MPRRELSQVALDGGIGVTGASGFVGRALTSRLTALGAHDLRLLGRAAAVVDGHAVKPVEHVDREFRGLRSVIHLAAMTAGGSQEKLRTVNVDMAAETARAAAAAGVRRFIFFSSLHTYGKSSAAPVGPTTPLAPQNAYGKSKADAERALAEIAASSGLELIVLRPPMVYGPGPNPNLRLLQKLVRSGLPLPFGNAIEPRSFCSIENVVSACVAALTVRNPPQTGPDGEHILLPADPADHDVLTIVRHMAVVEHVRPLIFAAPKWLMKGALTGLGRADAYASLFEPLTIDREHWRQWDWSSQPSGIAEMAAAVT